MGTYKSIRVMVSTKDLKILDGVKSILEKQGVNLNEFSEQTKWWPDNMMKELTTAYPKVMFRVDFDGLAPVNYSRTAFYLGNDVVDSHWVLPYFPTLSKFKTGVSKRTKYIKRKEEQERREEETKKQHACNNKEKVCT